jgi:hypothetical protein
VFPKSSWFPRPDVTFFAARKRSGGREREARENTRRTDRELRESEPDERPSGNATGVPSLGLTRPRDPRSVICYITRELARAERAGIVSVDRWTAPIMVRPYLIRIIPAKEEESVSSWTR